MNGFTINGIPVGDSAPLIFIGGPCVIESEDLALRTASIIHEITDKLGIPFIFKSSFDKANRLSHRSFRGPGIKKGLEILHKIRTTVGVPLLTDVHSIEDVQPVAEVVDVLQIPAFLCRQTDLALTCGKTGKAVLIKKGQFMAPEDMKNSALKVIEGGSEKVCLCERGTFFGYHNLVVDMRSLVIMGRDFPVIFDVTHSVQIPGGGGHTSSGQPSFILPLARAAVATGVDGLFVETHPDPEKALCDGPTMLPLKNLEALLLSVMDIDRAVKDTQNRKSTAGMD